MIRRFHVCIGLAALAALATPSIGEAQESCPATDVTEGVALELRQEVHDFYQGLDSASHSEGRRGSAYAPDRVLGQGDLSTLALASDETIDDIEVIRLWRYGDAAWAAVKHVRSNSSNAAVHPERATLVWQRAGEDWDLRHAHLSRPVPLGSDIVENPAAEAAAPDHPTVRRTSSFWRSWTMRSFEQVADHYIERDDTLVFLPWVAEAFPSWDAFFSSARDILARSDRSDFLQKGPVHAELFSGVALTTGLFTADILSKDGTATSGDARYSLVWVDCGGSWKLSHEHLSSFTANGEDAPQAQAEK